jgi:hypothetical protein
LGKSSHILPRLKYDGLVPGKGSAATYIERGWMDAGTIGLDPAGRTDGCQGDDVDFVEAR